MSKVCCKWVSEDMRTKNNTLWEIGIPKELPDKDDLELCYPGLYHYYEHPLLAVIFKRDHVPTTYARLYEVKPEGKVIRGWDKY